MTNGLPDVDLLIRTSGNFVLVIIYCGKYLIVNYILLVNIGLILILKN